MRGRQDTGIVFGKNLFKINTCCFFQVWIQKCNFLERYSVPEINDQSVFLKAGSISRQSGRSKPDTGSQRTADTLYTFCLDKILLTVFGGKMTSKFRIIDHEERRDLRQIIFDVFEKIAGIIVIMAVIRRGKQPDMRIGPDMSEMFQAGC